MLYLFSLPLRGREKKTGILIDFLGVSVTDVSLPRNRKVFLDGSNVKLTLITKSLSSLFFFFRISPSTGRAGEPASQQRNEACARRNGVSGEVAGVGRGTGAMASRRAPRPAFPPLSTTWSDHPLLLHLPLTQATQAATTPSCCRGEGSRSRSRSRTQAIDQRTESWFDRRPKRGKVSAH